MKLKPFALLAAAAGLTSVLGAPAVLAADNPVVEVNCICKKNNGKRYSGLIHVTDANRDAIAQSIRDGNWELRNTIVLKSGDCSEVAAKAVMLHAFCKPEQLFTGEMRLKVNSTGGIPRKDGKLDEGKWPRTKSIVVGGKPVK
jgi:hypothetical protein